ncbi:unnamed protein product, partial [Brenthis ino]
MEHNEHFMVPSNVPAVIPSEIITSTNIIEEGLRICPLCSSEIRFFFINFNEKMLMCENTECDFPFGYENLQFLRVDNDEEISDMQSVRTKPTSPRSPPSNSIVSAGAWSEIDKINKVYDSEEIQLAETRQFTSLTGKAKLNRKLSFTKDSEIKIKKNVEDIKGLNMELQEITASSSILSNEKWINNLKNLQDTSGIQLLRPQELRRVQQETKEVKININTDLGNNMSSIKIQIANT